MNNILKIEIIKNTAFPSNLRIRKYYDGKFDDPEFAALLCIRQKNYGKNLSYYGRE
jgi:hypothetical protein